MKNMLKSNTIRILTVFGIVLLTLYSMGDELIQTEVISAKTLEYIKIVLTLLESLLGIKFRLDSEMKPRLDDR